MASDERETFLILWRDAGQKLDQHGLGWTAVGAELADRHEETHRRYHGLRHIVSVLTVLDQLAGGRPIGPIPALAAFFHDAIYEPTAADNEEQSARLAEDQLAAVGVSDDTITSVASIIRATATHASDGTLDCDVFLDADLSILGSPPHTYEQYTEGIRFEYSFMETAAFAQGRAAILRRMLDRPRLFLTEAGRDRFEAQARANLSGEIEVLAALESDS